jgi:hypothetical protein
VEAGMEEPDRRQGDGGQQVTVGSTLELLWLLSIYILAL